ncbi:MAG: rRNA adenine dimethyltransferase family protein, partial [Pseudomonadota bacterium]
MRDVIKTHDLKARKSFGQNFLLDLNLTCRIARHGNVADRIVIEVGPGPGGLTRALLHEGAAHVLAVERDERCRAILAEIGNAFPARLTPVFEDALTFDIHKHLQPSQLHPPPVIVANLPYGIATPLLTGWLESNPWPPWWARMVLMFQKEVAERIVATPGTKAYGRLA